MSSVYCCHLSPDHSELLYGFCWVLVNGHVPTHEMGLIVSDYQMTRTSIICASLQRNPRKCNRRVDPTQSESPELCASEVQTCELLTCKAFCVSTCGGFTSFSVQPFVAAVCRRLIYNPTHQPRTPNLYQAHSIRSNRLFVQASEG